VAASVHRTLAFRWVQVRPNTIKERGRSLSLLFGTGVHNVLDEKHRHECAYSTVPQRYLCFHHKKRGIIMKKVKIKLDDMERLHPQALFLYVKVNAPDYWFQPFLRIN
jgi:hypothetical protein